MIIVKAIRNRLLPYGVVLLVVGIAWLLSGCASRTLHVAKSVTIAPDGTVTETVDANYENYGFDTKSGNMTFRRNPDGSYEATVENWEGNDASARVADKALDLANKVIPAVP